MADWIASISAISWPRAHSPVTIRVDGMIESLVRFAAEGISHGRAEASIAVPNSSLMAGST